jgi:hypothetical protein
MASDKPVMAHLYCCRSVGFVRWEVEFDLIAGKWVTKTRVTRGRRRIHL